MNPFSEFQIITTVWSPKLGKCLLDSLYFYFNCKDKTTIPSEYAACNLFLISKLLKNQEAQHFFSISPLTEGTFKILLISHKYTDIVEQCFHVLIKTCKFYNNPFFNNLPIPYDINEMFLIFKDAYFRSELCEEYVSRFLKQIIIFFDFTHYTKKICDLYYFILKNAKSERSIKHLMLSLDLLISCDVKTNLDQIINSEILIQFRIYLKQHSTIYSICPKFLIPFFIFFEKAVFLGDYHPVYKLFKIIHINFFKKMYRNKSNWQIQYYILNIFSQYLKKPFFSSDQNKRKELDKISELLIVVLNEFNSIEFKVKSFAIQFAYTLLRSDNENTCRILLENSTFFFNQFSYFAFNSNDYKTLKYYFKMLNFVFNYATYNDDQIFFLQEFTENELGNQISSLIDENALDEKNQERAHSLMRQINIAQKRIDEKEANNLIEQSAK